MKKRIISFALALLVCLAPLSLGASAAGPTANIVYPVLGGNIYINPNTGYVHGADDYILEAYIPSSVQGVQVVGVETMAFSGCFALSIVSLPSTVKYIGDNAFYDCTGLKSVNIPNGVSSIGYSAFKNCSSLESLSLPASVTEIKDFAFSGSGLKNISIPSGVTELPLFSFAACEKLEWISLPASLLEVGEGAFNACGALEQVRYAGSLRQWKQIEIAPYNGPLHWAELQCAVYDVPEDLFGDVKPADWFYRSVTAVAEAGLVAGKPDGSFAPQEELSWAQAVTLAVRYAQSAAGEYVYTAEDQIGDNWYDIYFEYAIDHGFIGSMPENPNGIISRGDAAVLFAGVLGYFEQINEVPEDYFTDVPASGEIHDAVYLLAGAGICNGKGGGTFGTGESFRRSEVATIIARMAGLVRPAELM